MSHSLEKVMHYDEHRYGFVTVDTIRPGMFRDEHGVEIVDAEGQRHAGFFPGGTVIEGRLAVFLKAETLGGNTILVIPSTNGGGYGFFSSSALWVPKEKVNEVTEGEFERLVYRIARVGEDEKGQMYRSLL